MIINKPFLVLLVSLFACGPDPVSNRTDGGSPGIDSGRPVRDSGAADVPGRPDVATFDASASNDAGAMDVWVPRDVSTTDTSTNNNECYSEPVSPEADISDLVARYGGSDWKDVLIEAFQRRHPASAWLLNAQRNDSYFSQFSDSRSWSGMVGWIDTLSHEETHLFNAYNGQGMGWYHSIYFTPDHIVYLNNPGGFPRSRVRSMMAVQSNGQYANTYLQGEQGNRGFLSVLDETSCYLNELAALGVVGEHFPLAGVSSRDGSVALLYMLELYLRIARTEFPADYARWQSNEDIVDIVATLWVRTHFFLSISDRHPSLGIEDLEYRRVIHEPANEAEIEMFIGRPVGDSPCFADD